jgi:outer membrane lipoprotein-sorting protein
MHFTWRVFAALSIFLLAGFLFSKGSFAQQKPLRAGTEAPPLQEIIQKSHMALFYAGDDFKAKVHMRLQSKGGEERIRDFTMLRKDTTDGGDQKYFIYFYNPADVRDMTFMVAKYPQKDDDRWLYMPALKMVRRIAANDKRSSFVGSDFTYEDVSGRDIEEDTHSLLGEETVAGKACYKVKSVPKSPKSADYSQKVSWIEKASFIPLKEEYYDKRSTLYKVFTAEEVKEVQGFPTIMKRTMQNVQSGHKTEVTFTEVKYNQKLPEEVFSERSLRTAPMEWIR